MFGHHSEIVLDAAFNVGEHAQRLEIVVRKLLADEIRFFLKGLRVRVALVERVR
jgi:hypothetical protein